MPKLCVNIDHIATIRQARRTYEPDPVWAAHEAQLGGADGITVHLREDRRHIQDQDVYRLRQLVSVPLNLEIAPVEEMILKAEKIRPEMVMLVPEKREEITTEGGLDLIAQESHLKQVVARCQAAGIAVSAFINADFPQIEAAARIGIHVCEIHTGPYAHAFYDYGRKEDTPQVQQELCKISAAGAAIQQLGMQFNAGHALNYYNVQPIATLSGIQELHIGHAIISRAVFVGLRQAITQMKALLS